MGFTSLVLASVFGRLTRSLLTISGMAVAVGAVVALVGISSSFESSIVELYESRGIDLLVLQSGKAVQHSSVLPEILVEEIGKLPEVEKVSAMLQDLISLDDIPSIAVLGIPVGSFLIGDFEFVEGRGLQASDLEPDAAPEGSNPECVGGVILGKRLADALETQVGRTLELLDGESYRVVGIFKSNITLEESSIIMPLESLQSLMLRQGEVTEIFVVGQEHDYDSLSALQVRIKELAERIPEVRSGVDVEKAREFAENTPEIKMARSMAWVTSLIAVMVGAIGMLNTMLMAVFERTSEIAMLRAIGWRKSRIVWLILWESVLLSIGGAVMGCLLAKALTWQLSRIPKAALIVTGSLSWGVMLQGLGIALIVGLAGGLYPAWKASRLLPVEGLRHD